MAALSLHLPEVAPSSGLEVPYNGVEGDPEGPERLLESISLFEKEARPIRKVFQVHSTRWSRRYCRVTIVGLTALLVVLAIVGAVIEKIRSKLVVY